MSAWQTGVPPVTGWYEVLWEPGDRVAHDVYVHAFTHRGTAGASWGDTPEDDSQSWGEEESAASWRLRSPAAMPGLPLPPGAIGWRFVYRG